MIESPYIKDINSSRRVIYLEEKPFSNKYHQLILSKEQFKQISLLLWNMYPQHPETMIDGTPARTIEMSDEEIKLPSEINSYKE